MSVGGGERYEENGRSGKVTSSEGKAAQYAAYMSGAGLVKWKDRIAQRKRPAVGWRSIEYDAAGNVVGERQGFDTAPSADVEKSVEPPKPVKRPKVYSLAENLRGRPRKQRRPQFTEAPMWSDMPQGWHRKNDKATG